MTIFLPLVLNAALLLTLLLILLSDLHHRRISNRKILCIACLAMADWIAQPHFGWGDVAVRLGLMLGAIGLFSIPFLFHWMGGGDVKLFGALALWCDADKYLQLLLVISLVGIPVSLYGLARRTWLQPHSDDFVPYGIAIALGAIWVLCQPVINHFVG